MKSSFCNIFAKINLFDSSVTVTIVVIQICSTLLPCMIAKLVFVCPTCIWFLSYFTFVYSWTTFQEITCYHKVENTFVFVSFQIFVFLFPMKNDLCLNWSLYLNKKHWVLIIHYCYCFSIGHLPCSVWTGVDGVSRRRTQIQID